MAITVNTPESILTSEIYAALNEQGGNPSLMPEVARILAAQACEAWRTVIMLGSILNGLSLAAAGYLTGSAVCLACAAVAFLVTAICVALWRST